MIVGAMTMILVLFTKEWLVLTINVNCVVSTGEDNQSSNTDSDTDGHDTGIVLLVWNLKLLIYNLLSLQTSFLIS